MSLPLRTARQVQEIHGLHRTALYPWEKQEVFRPIGALGACGRFRKGRKDAQETNP